MKSFLVANPKGGAGKSTLATNLAGWLAREGHRVMLGDVDRQQSSAAWLRMRAPSLPHIATWEIDPGQPARPPKDSSHVVLDSGWEAKMAESLEEMPEVVAYVKNQGLGFTIPYTLNGEERSYIDFYARRSGSGTVQGLLAISDRLAPAPRPGGSDG